MSGLKPFFITGSNAKIQLNGKTLAFCTDLSYSVQVITQTPKVLGMYEGSSVEPLGYTVSGSFTIIRYAKDIQDSAGFPNGIAKNGAGNGVGNWGSAWGGGRFANVSGMLGQGNDGRANESLNPSTFSQGTTFDIQVYQKTQSRSTGSATNEQVITDYLSGSTPTNLNNVVGVANIRNCRITQADFQISKKSVATQRFNFVALYVDEDAFVADFSGSGQHF